MPLSDNPTQKECSLTNHIISPTTAAKMGYATDLQPNSFGAGRLRRSFANEDRNAALVVKNGLNIFSLTSGGMPVLSSRILISTLLPSFLLAAASHWLVVAPIIPALRFVAA